MYGNAGLKLITDAKRAISLDLLPEYQKDLVKAVLREISELDREVARLKDVHPDFQPDVHTSIACQILVAFLSMRRNKRCLLAYHRARAEKIEQIVWQNTSGEFSAQEEDYKDRYSELIAAYKDSYADIDLGASLDPPRNLFVDVRVMKDAGEIQTEYGVLSLTKNSQFFVRQGDVERLIQQGYLAIVN